MEYITTAEAQRKNNTRYQDLDINLIPHPHTGDIGVKKDSNAINNAIKNLVLTNYYERLFAPRKAGHVSGLLFENATPITQNELRIRITDIIEDHEPRCELQDVVVNVQEEQNAFEVRIYYSATTSTDLVEYKFFLERVI